MPTNGLSVLVIESNENEREVIVKTLDGDFTVLTASDPLHGVLLARTRKPSVVILGLSDSNGMDGFTQFRETFQDVPVVVVGGDDWQTINEVVAAGAREYLTKPVKSSKSLLDAVNKALSDAKRNEKLLSALKTIERIDKQLQILEGRKNGIFSPIGEPQLIPGAV
jgi:DNA-binding response OmpR family regulator